MASDELEGIAEKAAQGGVFLFVGNAVAIAILAVGSIIIARLLGPSNYGLYSLTFVTPTLFVSFADVGMNYVLVNFPARLRSTDQYDAANRAIRLGILLKVAVSVVAFLVCYLGADAITATVLNRPELGPYLRLAAVLIILQAVFDATTNSFIGLDLMHYSASTQILYALLKSVLGPAFVLAGLGLVGAITGYLLGALVAGTVGAAILFVRFVHPEAGVIQQHSDSLRAMLAYGTPLYLAAIFTVFIGQYQNLVLPRFADNVQIGNFNAAWNFNIFLSILISPISTAIFPMFSKMDPYSERSDLVRAFSLAVKYASFVLLPASIGVMVFSKNLIYLTYGAGYVLAPRYLMIVSAYCLLTGIGLNVISSFLNGVAATRTTLKITALTLGVYIPLGPILTWIDGPNGLLIAYIVSYTVSTLYGVRSVSSSFDAQPDYRSSLRTLLASLVAAVLPAILIEVRAIGTDLISLIGGGVLYLIIYLTLMPIFGAVDSQDTKNLETLLCNKRAVALYVRPVLTYERRILSAMGCKIEKQKVY